VLRKFGSIALSLLAAGVLWAQPTASRAEYPEKPIHLIVPQAAGSATDTVARILAAELSPQLGGQSVIVEDRPGGALTIGIDIVAKSAPDGYTIGVGPIGALAITRHMVAKLPYNIEKDLQPIALIARGHLMLAVSPKSEFHSVKELIAYAKANPGKLTNASSSNGSPGHVGGELFKFMTGTQIQHVPYRGGGGGGGLAVSGDTRSIAFPDIPTVAEAGVPGYSAPTWSGVIGPAGMPRPIVDKLNAAINRAIQTEAFKARFAAIGDEPAPGTPEDFAAIIAKDSAKWKEVVERAGVKLD
jgi:tripartite-type tricarboxylate transporter receptor subunit TctC